MSLIGCPCRIYSKYLLTVFLEIPVALASTLNPNAFRIVSEFFELLLAEVFLVSFLTPNGVTIKFVKGLTWVTLDTRLLKLFGLMPWSFFKL